MPINTGSVTSNKVLQNSDVNYLHSPPNPKLSVGVPAGPPSRDDGIQSVWNTKKGATPGAIKEPLAKILLLLESTGLLREHFDVHCGAVIGLAAMMTTRN